MAVEAPVVSAERNDIRMTKRILHVVTNVSHYADPGEPTGLWLSELTHAYDVFEAEGYEQRIVSPKGGKSPLEPRALLLAWRFSCRRHDRTRSTRPNSM